MTALHPRGLDDVVTALDDRSDLRAAAEAGIRALLLLVGENPGRPGLVDTPRRVVDAFVEMTARPGDPGELLSRTFDDVGDVHDLVIVGPVRFASLCEHHLLPFVGRVWIGYLPNGPVVGLSKLARLVDHYARRIQVQERLTGQLAAEVEHHLNAHGVGVRIVAEHACMTVRGVDKPGAEMTTTALRGDLRTEPYRAEFLAAVHIG